MGFHSLKLKGNCLWDFDDYWSLNWTVAERKEAAGKEFEDSEAVSWSLISLWKPGPREVSQRATFKWKEEKKLCMLAEQPMSSVLGCCSHKPANHNQVNGLPANSQLIRCKQTNNTQIKSWSQQSNKHTKFVLCPAGNQKFHPFLHLHPSETRASDNSTPSHLITQLSS